MIRKAIPDDAQRLAEIHIFGWRTAYFDFVDHKYLFKRINVLKRIDTFREALKDESEETYVFEENEIIKGFMTLGKCRDDDFVDCFELWGIYIEPLMTNQGIGTKMIQYCEEQAVKRGFNTNILWVLEKNDNARKFYEKCGYSLEGKKKYLDRINTDEVRYIKILKN